MQKGLEQGLKVAGTEFSPFDSATFGVILTHLALAIHGNALHAYFANFAAREKCVLRS